MVLFDTIEDELLDDRMSLIALDTENMSGSAADPAPSLSPEPSDSKPGMDDELIRHFLPKRSSSATTTSRSRPPPAQQPAPSPAQPALKPEPRQRSHLADATRFPSAKDPSRLSITLAYSSLGFPSPVGVRAHSTRGVHSRHLCGGWLGLAVHLCQVE